MDSPRGASEFSFRQVAKRRHCRRFNFGIRLKLNEPCKSRITLSSLYYSFFRILRQTPLSANKKTLAKDLSYLAFNNYRDIRVRAKDRPKLITWSFLEKYLSGFADGTFQPLYRRLVRFYLRTTFYENIKSTRTRFAVRSFENLFGTLKSDEEAARSIEKPVKNFEANVRIRDAIERDRTRS